MKRVLIKNRTNQTLFKHITGLAVPSFPVVIHWGTWIDFACFIHNNFSDVQKFMEELSKVKNDKDDVYQLINSEDFEKQIRIIKRHEFLVLTINKLQDETLYTKCQPKIIMDARKKIDEIGIYSER